jgi:AcrR family transcriptional regulator
VHVLLDLQPLFWAIDRGPLRTAAARTGAEPCLFHTEAALAALEAKGIDAVKVFSLSETLGVTRGSFYWHFRDRQDLLSSMLEWWDRGMTETVLDEISSLGGDPRARLWRAMELITEGGKAAVDPAIRAWALYDPGAAAFVRRVDRKRIEFIRGFFREMGFSKEEVEARARMLAVYLMSDPFVFAHEPRSRRRRLLRLRHRLLTSPASGPTRAS